MADLFDRYNINVAPEPTQGGDLFDRYSTAKPDLGPAIAAAGGGPEPTTLERVEGRTKDVLTRAADSMSFGLLPKLAARISSWEGRGTYDEALARERRRVEEAGDRLGTTGSILSDIGGGLLSGSALARSGVTLLGRAPRTATVGEKAFLGALEGAGYGAAQGAGHTDADNAQAYLTNAGKGGILGLATGGVLPFMANAAQRVLTPFRATPQRTAMVETLDDAGVHTSAAQRVGNRTLRNYEDLVGKLPLGRNPTRDQMEGFTQEVMRRSGIAAQAGETATPEVLQRGATQIGQGIQQIQQRNPMQYDNTLLGELVNINQNARVLSRGEQSTINEFTNRLLQPGATLTPEAMAALRTDLRLAYQKGPDAKPLFNRAIANLRDAIDDALARSIQRNGNADDLAALEALRQQYANLNVLTDAVSRSGESGAHGVLTPTALSAAQKASVGRTNYTRGVGDLSELARASTGVLRTPPDSFTNTRSSLMDVARLAAALPARAAVTSRPAQAYWGNQISTGPISPQATQGATAGVLGPADRIIQGLLMP